MELFFSSLLLLLLGGIIAIFVKENAKMKVCSFFAGLSLLFVLKPCFLSIFNNDILTYQMTLSAIFGPISIVIDPLSAFFVLVISFMTFIGTIYANGYIKSYFDKGMNTSFHSFFLMLLIASMMFLVTVQNALFFLVIWEIMSLSSFFLVIFEDNKKEVLNAGIKYMIYMHLCVIFLISAFALLSIKSGSLDFSTMASVLNNDKSLANVVFLLAFIGFGTKAGFIPFHNWLPDAHPAAPSHVSGIMSGIMIKTGIYGLLRILFMIGQPTKMIVYLVLIISIISALWGVLYAITQHDIKKLLAYHSVENIGIIGIGIGIGLFGLLYDNQTVALLGFLGGILHILNHSIFKMLLFFAAGSVYSKTHTRDIELLGGLIKNMPYTAALFLIGSVAICGLPPFNGFVSELLIYAGVLQGLPGSSVSTLMVLIITLSSLALVGTMAILCFTKVFGIVFLGVPRSDFVKIVTSDVAKVMIFPMSILALLTLIIGLFPQFAILLLLSPIKFLLQTNLSVDNLFPVLKVVSLISFVSFIFISVFIVLLIIRFFIANKSKVHNTWGCGYKNVNSRMQYSASSYADLFISTLKPLFKRISHIKKPKDLFPKDAYYEVKIEDLEEAYIVKPLIRLDEKILSKFERIQNGNMQQYILFGLIFLVVMLFGLIIVG